MEFSGFASARNGSKMELCASASHRKSQTELPGGPFCQQCEDLPGLAMQTSHRAKETKRQMLEDARRCPALALLQPHWQAHLPDAKRRENLTKTSQHELTALGNLLGNHLGNYIKLRPWLNFAEVRNAAQVAQSLFQAPWGWGSQDQVLLLKQNKHVLHDIYVHATEEILVQSGREQAGLDEQFRMVRGVHQALGEPRGHLQRLAARKLFSSRQGS